MLTPSHCITRLDYCELFQPIDQYLAVSVLLFQWFIFVPLPDPVSTRHDMSNRTNILYHFILHCCLLIPFMNSSVHPLLHKVQQYKHFAGVWLLFEADVEAMATCNKLRQVAESERDRPTTSQNVYVVARTTHPESFVYQLFSAKLDKY